jgi:hypothetical protein
MSAPKQRTIDDLSDEEIHRLEERMRPLNYSQVGFLGASESLREIIERDSALLRERGITHDQIADRLDTLIGSYNRINELARRDANQRGGFLERAVTEVPGGNLHMSMYFGWQPCPWALEDSESEATCGLTDQDWRYFDAHGRELSFSGLMPHLIRDHHFFEGTTRYRVDPAHAIEVLGIEPGVDYAPHYKEEAIWKPTDPSMIGIESGEDYDRFRWPDFLTTVPSPAGDVRISIIGGEGIITSASRSIRSIIDQPPSIPSELVIRDKLHVNETLTLPRGTLYPLFEFGAIIPIRQVTDRYVEE